MNFEESLQRLEEITQMLESQELSLDDSLKIFEEGIKLSRFCGKKLTEAEQKLEILKTSDIEEFVEENEVRSEKKKVKNKKEAIDRIEEEKESNSDNFLF